jgi:hypothetical protein
MLSNQRRCRSRIAVRSFCGNELLTGEMALAVLSGFEDLGGCVVRVDVTFVISLLDREAGNDLLYHGRR